MMDEVGEVGGSKPTLLLFAKAAFELYFINLFKVMISSVVQLS